MSLASRARAAAAVEQQRTNNQVELGIDATFATYGVQTGETGVVSTSYPVGDVRRYGALGDSITDEIALGGFQRAHDALPSTGGTITVPAGIYLLNGSGATLASPKILCTVSKPNVQFVISKGAKFLMVGWSKADSDANNDAGAGTNVFTGILFGNGVVGGGVTGGYVQGDSDGTAITNLRSRAKFIAIDGASSIAIEDVTGKLIVGNLVNARGNGSGLGYCDDISVTDCKAFSCAESGFNYMGGVRNSVFSDNVSRLNKYHGFESGAERLTCVGNICCDNAKDGITQVGRHGTFADNICNGNGIAGFNFQWSASSGSDGSKNRLEGGECSENGSIGIACDGGTSHNSIKDVDVFDNGTGAGEGIKLNITCTRYTIQGCTVADTGVAKQATGIDVITGSHITLRGNTTYGHATQGLTVNTNSDDIKVLVNTFDDAVVISSTTTNKFVRNNKGYVTENSGTATIASGTTSIAVTHGLSTAGTTTSAAIQVTPTNALGSAAKFWFDTLNSTQFTIHTNIDPGAGGATFVWSASVQT